jgi:cell division protein FtsQ
MRISSILLWLTGLMATAWLVINVQMLSWPVSGVDIEKTGHHISNSEIIEVVDPMLEAGWLSLDINAVQAQVAAIPWVERVQVYRVFPDRLALRMEEKVPVARYGDTALISKTGKCFQPASLVDIGPLPHLEVEYPLLAFGHQGLLQVQATLASMAALPQDIDRIRYQADIGWDLAFHSGLQVRLGRSPIEQSLARWAHYYPKILHHKKGAMPKKVDLRYANGAAVS